MNKKLNFPWIALLRLSKPIITLSVAFSALTGFILFRGSFSSGWFFLYLGVLFIAAGSSAINQTQEADLDQLMERTRLRPLPSGQLNHLQAWAWAVLLSVSGATILWISTHPTASIMAIITLLWYNGVYTPLKRVTPWAILPGALVGAFPPLIGWTAAGGHLLHPHIVFVAFFFFIGQIPHFWLILLKHGKDYQKAGFPSINDTFSPEQISRLTFIWTTVTAIAAIFLPVFGVIISPVLSILIITLSIVLIISFHKWPGIKSPVHVNRAFMVMNMYFLMIMIIIILDGLLR